MSITGVISNISRCSLHDGPGVRTVVYLKGCGLRCQWCHNPETFTMEREILYAPSKCIHCGRCVEVCPEHHKIQGNDMVFIREGCTKCGKCADVCPTGALSACGEQKTVDEVLKEIVKDKHYFSQSNGGVTFSGGDCLLQADFTAAVLKACQEENIHTAIESEFFVPWENVEKVIPYTDFFYADCKLPDPERHRIYTGQDNRLILENISRLAGTGKRIIIRIPLIPGVNDSEEDMAAFGKVIGAFAAGIEGVELLRYNYLGKSKYELLGKEYVSFGEEAQGEVTMQSLRKKLQEQLPSECKVFYR